MSVPLGGEGQLKKFSVVLVNGEECHVYVSQSRGVMEWELKYRLPDGRRHKVSTRLLNEVPNLGARAEQKIREAKRSHCELWGNLAVAYKRSVQLLKAFKLPLDEAVWTLVKALEMLQGHDLLRAVQFYVDKGMLRCIPITFEKFVEFYLQKEFGSPDSAKTSAKRTRSIAEWVRKMVKDPNVQLVDVPVAVLNGWVHESKTTYGYYGRDNRRVHLITMYNYALTHDFWPLKEPTTADRIRPGVLKRADRPLPEVFNLEELKTLLYHLWSKREHHPRYEQAFFFVIFGTFIGTRSFENTRIMWEDVNLDSGLTRVWADAAKTMKAREFYLPPNLLAFLRELGGRRSGPLVDSGWLDDAKEEFRLLGYDWPWNGPRHSFASAWHTLVGSIHTLAKLMGTSVAKLRKHYLRDVPVEWALGLFDIYPPGYEGPQVRGEELVEALRKMVPHVAQSGKSKKAERFEVLKFVPAPTRSRIVEPQMPALGSPVASTPAPSIHVRATPETLANLPAKAASVVLVAPALSLAATASQNDTTPAKPRVTKCMVKAAKRQALAAWRCSAMRKQGKPMPKNAWEMYVDWNKYSRRGSR